MIRKRKEHSATIQNPDKADNFEFYTRTFDRESTNYKNLVNSIDREPDIVYPEKWFDYDVDRMIVGGNCVYHGMQEWKHINNVSNPYVYNKKQRKDVIGYLKKDHFKIETYTLNFSYDNRKNVWNGNELNAHPVDLNYNQYLKNLRSVKESNKTMGKGVFIYIIYAHNLEYFSVINFTNSDYILKRKRFRNGRNDLTIYLEDVAKVIEPCFNELLLFILEAYIRNDFKKLYEYFTEGIKDDRIRLKNNQEILTKKFEDFDCSVPLWLALKDTMEDIMETIHFDNILEEARGEKVDNSYKQFAESVKDGSIFGKIAESLEKRYKDYKSAEAA